MTYVDDLRAELAAQLAGAERELAALQDVIPRLRAALDALEPPARPRRRRRPARRVSAAERDGQLRALVGERGTLTVAQAASAMRTSTSHVYALVKRSGTVTLTDGTLELAGAPPSEGAAEREISAVA